VDVVNVGQTPAHSLYIDGEAHFDTAKVSKEITYTQLMHIGSVARNAVVEVRGNFRLTQRQLAQLERGTAQVTIYLSLPFFDEFEGSWTYQHTLQVTRKSLVTGNLFTMECRHIRREPESEKKEPDASQELPLEGGSDGPPAA